MPLVDHLSQELQSRFFQGQETILSGVSLVPSMMLGNPDWKSSFLKFSKFYKEDLPAPLSLEAEVILWEHQWRQEKSDLPTTAVATLKVMDAAMFPNITRALRILATIPVTSCECERAVSSLRHLKTYMRSTMHENRLTGLAMMHVHYTHEIALDTIIQNFAIQHPWRMDMVNLLND